MAPSGPGAQLAADSRAALDAGGALSRMIAGFTPRQAQLSLADAVADTLMAGDTLLAEAGTGTGKTFAYLVPALLSGHKTIVSTGTRALQDQLYHRDLPRVRDALGTGLRTALLKGRANYLCHHRLERARGEPRLASPQEVSLLQRIVTWSGRTRLGDLSEIQALPEASPLIAMVTSTADNCLGGECPFWSTCFVVQARQRAQAADLVVVNHHLLLADLALKQEGFGEILPGAQAFVVDEAHQLPELAAQFFGEGLSARPLVDLAREAQRESRDVEGALAAVQGPAQQLEAVVRLMRTQMESLPPRGTAQQLQRAGAVGEGLQVLGDALQHLAAALAPLRAASPALEACHARSADAAARLARWQGESGPGDEDPSTDMDADVRWYELSPRGFRLQRTPLDVAAPLRAHRERSQAAWVFTSATLTVGSGFSHITARLGLDAPRTLTVPSPFDWNTQALCYLPQGLPAPASRGYSAALVEAIRPVLEASGGRAFVLFASHRALREAADLLRDGPWPLFVQGQAPRHVLLERFRTSGNGVLLGAASFREGVDVAGAALSVVVIDKLPFAAPDDPVFQARLEAVRRAGGNPFADEQLPQAVIALKQGVGRLIRSETDRGVLVLCDPRLSSHGYRHVFLGSLPPFPRSSDLARVQAFFHDDTPAHTRID